MKKRIQELIDSHSDVMINPERRVMIQKSVENGEAIVSGCGALATWTPVESTGRSPKDTVTVRRRESEGNIDWDSPNNLPIEASTFDMLFEDAIKQLSTHSCLYVTDRVVGADPSLALPIRTVTCHALAALFTDNMFRKVPEEIATSVFADNGFQLLVLPYDKLDSKRYDGRLRRLPETGQTSNMAIAMDLDRRIGIVYGSAYGGSVKKLIFYRDELLFTRGRHSAAALFRKRRSER